MPRIFLVLIALGGLILPVAAGLCALSSGAQNRAGLIDLGSLDADLLDRAASNDTTPLDLTPPSLEPLQEPTSQSPSDVLAELPQEELVALVRSALLADPFILEEVADALEVERAAREEALAAQVIEQNSATLFSADNASVLGNPNGSITLVEFLDYNCGFCKQAHADMLRIVAEYPDVRVLVRDFPVLGSGSLEAAQVATAFRSISGDMATFIDIMMTEDAASADTELAMRVAVDLGADPQSLNTALQEPGLMAPIRESYELAEMLNIRGTPAFVVGQQRIVGAVGFDRLSDAIQIERERLSAL